MKKILLDLSVPIMDLDENSATGMSVVDPTKTLGRSLAEMLKSSQEDQNGVQFMVWMIELWKTGTVEVTETEFRLLRSFVQNHRGSWALLRGQMVQQMDSCLEGPGQSNGLGQRHHLAVPT